MPTSAGDYSPAATYEEALKRAARAWGVQEEFWDIFGVQHIAGPEVERAILSSKGLPTESLEDLNAAIRKRAELDWAALAPATLVLTLSGGVVPVNVPEELANAQLTAEFHWENGTSEVAHWPVESLAVESRTAIGDQRLSRRLLPLPRSAPLGYHQLLLSAGGRTAETRLILCPSRAFRPPFLERGEKGSGLAISLYGLRSERNWGCGDFTDLQRFCAWAIERAGVSFVALNPLHAIPNRQPYNTSPYLPNCTFYRNALYLDVEAIEDVRDSEEAQRLFASEETRRRFEELRNSEYVEYEKVYALKLQFLKLGYETYRRGKPSPEFLAFVEAEGDLLDKFALYSALDQVIHERDPNMWIWPDWPREFQDIDSSAVQAFRQEYADLVLFYKWTQWHVDRQLAEAQHHAKSKGMAIGLYHDLALATDRCGSDLWAHGSFYVGGCRVGSPPDDFSPNGQDWAFPPPNALTHKLDGYRLFAESIRKNCKHGGALRIDHVMRFFRLFWIPEGRTAKEGAYVMDDWGDLVRILALESVRNQVVVIGEDLGTVEPFIREALQRFGVLSYRLLYFEKNGPDFRDPGEYPQEALVSVSTHDLPTLAGFWQNSDIEARRKAGVLPDEQSYRTQLQNREKEKQKMLDSFHRLQFVPSWFARQAKDVGEFTGEMHYAAVGFLASTPSELMVLNQEDLFKEMDQQNLPGTTEQYPNWRHKMRYSLDQLWHHPHAEACTTMFRRWMERTERLNPS